MPTEIIISIVIPILSIVIAVISLVIALYEPLKKFILRRCMRKIDIAIQMYKKLNPYDFLVDKKWQNLLNICYSESDKRLMNAIPYSIALSQFSNLNDLDLFQYLFEEVYDKISIHQLLFITLSYWNLIIKKLEKIAKILNTKEYIYETRTLDNWVLSYGSKQDENYRGVKSKLFLLGDISQARDIISKPKIYAWVKEKRKVDLEKIIKSKCSNKSYWNIRKALKSNNFGVCLSFVYDSKEDLNHEYALIFNENGELSDLCFWYMEYLKNSSNSYEFIQKYRDEIQKSINNLNDFFFNKGNKLILNMDTLDVSYEEK